jgi:ABC-2 type transport system permease protein
MTLKSVSTDQFWRALHSRLLQILSLLFFTAVVATIVVYVTGSTEASTGPGRDPSPIGLLYIVAFALRIFVPLFALVVGYTAFSETVPSAAHPSQDRGTAIQPSPWWGVVLGRTAAVMVISGGGLAVGALASALAYGTLAVGLLLQIALASLLFALAYSSIIATIATISDSTTTSRTVSFGTVLIMEVLWVNAILPLVFLGTDGFFPAWTYPASLLPPGRAYLASLAAVNAQVPIVTTGNGPIPSAGVIEASYGTPWVGVGVLALWVTVPLLFGHWITSRY